MTEAPTGFRLESNGFAEESARGSRILVRSPNSPTIPPDECDFEAALEEFTGPEDIADGVGPVFNAVGCGDCHLVPSIGGFSQVVEKRAGYWDGARFTDHPGGSFMHDGLSLSIEDAIERHGASLARPTRVPGTARERSERIVDFLMSL